MIDMRRADIARTTKETKIDLHLNLDDASERAIDTGVPFLRTC